MDGTGKPASRGEHPGSICQCDERWRGASRGRNRRGTSGDPDLETSRGARGRTSLGPRRLVLGRTARAARSGGRRRGGRRRGWRGEKERPICLWRGGSSWHEGALSWRGRRRIQRRQRGRGWWIHHHGDYRRLHPGRRWRRRASRRGVRRHRDDGHPSFTEKWRRVGRGDGRGADQRCGATCESGGGVGRNHGERGAMDGCGDQQQRMHRQGDPAPDWKTSGGELRAPLDVLPQGEQEGASRRGAYGRAGHEPGDGPPRVECLADGAIEDGRGVAAAVGQPQRHAVQGLHED